MMVICVCVVLIAATKMNHQQRVTWHPLSIGFLFLPFGKEQKKYFDSAVFPNARLN
jgi:hypothetical protein